MGVDTKGVVLTKEKDFWEIRQRIGHAIYARIKTELPKKRSSVSVGEDGDILWKLPTTEIPESFYSTSPTFKSFWIDFVWNGQNRHIMIHLYCDCDLVDEFGADAKGVIISLGCWGDSVEIMKTVLGGLADLGGTFIRENDCSDEWVKVE